MFLNFYWKSYFKRKKKKKKKTRKQKFAVYLSDKVRKSKTSVPRTSFQK